MRPTYLGTVGVGVCLLALVMGCGNRQIGGTGDELAMDGGPLKLDGWRPKKKDAATKWTGYKAMPTPRVELGAAVVGDRLYAVGGYNGSVLGIVEQYNPWTNTWTRRKSMPTSRRDLVVTALGGRVYALGGASYVNPNNATYITANEAYDPTTDSWSTRAKIPLGPPVNKIYGNRTMAGAAAGGKLYLVVYDSTLPSRGTTLAYDPAKDSWTKKAPPPLPSGYWVKLSAAALEGKVFLQMEPSHGGKGLSFAEYDPATNAWKQQKNTNTFRQDSRVVAGRLRIYSVSGHDGHKTVGTVEAYQASFGWPGTWYKRPNLKTPRHSFGVASINGYIFVVGGSSAASPASPLGLVESWPGS